MPRNVIILLSALAITGCTGGRYGQKNTDQQLDTDTDLPSPTDSDFEAFPSSFTEGKFRFDRLALSLDNDNDNDGTVDNKLYNALLAVDLILQAEDMSPQQVNANFEANLRNYVTNILMQASHDGLGAITVGVMEGLADQNRNLSVDPDSLDVNNQPKQVLSGFFLTDTKFFAGPARLTVPVIFILGDPALPVTMKNTRLEGAMTKNQAAGTLRGDLPLETLMDDVVAPLVPDLYDMDGDGTPETKQDIMDEIWKIAPAVADVDTDGDGTNDAISAWFTWKAVPAEWPDP